jgi:uncharacterized membrane protein YccC
MHTNITQLINSIEFESREEVIEALQALIRRTQYSEQLDAQEEHFERIYQNCALCNDEYNRIQNDSHNNRDLEITIRFNENYAHFERHQAFNN